MAIKRDAYYRLWIFSRYIRFFVFNKTYSVIKIQNSKYRHLPWLLVIAPSCIELNECDGEPITLYHQRLVPLQVSDTITPALFRVFYLLTLLV